MTPEVKPARKIRGKAHVKKEVCKGCSYCIDFCPTKCLEFSRDYNSKGYHYPVVAKPELCSGCDMCGLYCPDFAIHGTRVKESDGRAS